MTDKSTDVSKQQMATDGVKASLRSAGWSGFAQKLAPVLANLAEDQYLIISVKHSNRFVQFSAQGSFGLRAETTSNYFLEKPEKLNRKQHAALLEIGWAAPTGSPRQSTPEKDPDGSPNHFVDFPVPVDFARVVDLAVTTFADVLRVPYPGMLQYEAFDCESNTALRLNELGLKQVQHQPQAKDATGHATNISEKLRDTLREVTGDDDLNFDSEGDIGIRYGSAIVYARVIGEPSVVHFFSPLLRNVDESDEMFARLNEVNGHSRQLRFFIREGTLFGVADVPAAPYVSVQVAQSFQEFCRNADDMDNLLQSEMGGITAFYEWLPSSTRH